MTGHILTGDGVIPVRVTAGWGSTTATFMGPASLRTGDVLVTPDRSIPINLDELGGRLLATQCSEWTLTFLHIPEEAR